MVRALCRDVVRERTLVRHTEPRWSPCAACGKSGCSRYAWRDDACDSGDSTVLLSAAVYCSAVCWHQREGRHDNEQV